jgi:hypothetical protein
MASQQNSFANVATIGIDIGKTTFHLIGQDRRGAIIMRGVPPKKWSECRDMIIPFSGGPEHGWQAREARRHRREAASG